MGRGMPGFYSKPLSRQRQGLFYVYVILYGRCLLKCTLSLPHPDRRSGFNSKPRAF